MVSEADRHEVKKAKKDGRLAEAMLDRRQKLKQWVLGPVVNALVRRTLIFMLDLSLQ